MSSDDWYASSHPSGGSYPSYPSNSQSNGYYGQSQQPPPPPPQPSSLSTNAFHPSSLSGPMGGPLPTNTPPNVFDPTTAIRNQQQYHPPPLEEDYDNEPPLLEELGVNFPHIYAKSSAVLFPYGQHAKTLQHTIMDDDDLAGPLAFALGLGGELLLSGKLQFGYVYGFGISGWIAMTLLLNLLNPNGAVNAWKVVSILGYALLPVNFLAGMNVLWRIGKMGWLGVGLAIVTIIWCTAASTRLFERGCDMRSQRFLVAYPAALFYSAFVMITIF